MGAAKTADGLSAGMVHAIPNRVPIHTRFGQTAIYRMPESQVLAANTRGYSAFYATEGSGASRTEESKFKGQCVNAIPYSWKCRCQAQSAQ